jgi:hypothetical protein
MSKSPITNVTASDPQLPRLRVRRVAEGTIAELAVAAAVEAGRPAIRADHGGGVANAYRYPAETETLVTVAFPDGRVVQWHGRAPANKVTRTFAGDLFDGRCGKERRALSRARWIRDAIEALCAAGNEAALVERDRLIATTPAPMPSELLGEMAVAS